MNKKIILFTCILSFCVFSLYARGIREEAAPERNIVQVTGTVRLVGTGMFPEIVITTDRGDWYIAGDEKYKLQDMQHRRVTVEGIETVTELTFAGGMSAGTRRTLSRVVVLRVE